MSTKKHYNKDYYKFQRKIGSFGAKANMIKFQKLIYNDLKVLDFGCGGGFLLNEFDAKIKKYGVEVNQIARCEAINKGIKCYKTSKDLPSNFFDLIISDNALEHCDNPYLEIKELYRALKKNGKICLVVPLDSLNSKYNENDINFHLYSWSPMNLGNILKANNFKVIVSEPFLHKWMPYYSIIKKFLPWKLFHFLCFIYARLDRSWFQIRAIAQKN